MDWTSRVLERQNGTSLQASKKGIMAKTTFEGKISLFLTAFEGYVY